MPLPPAPTKRAAFLSPDSYDAPAPVAVKPRKQPAQVSAEPSPVHRLGALEQAAASHVAVSRAAPAAAPAHPVIELSSVKARNRRTPASVAVASDDVPAKSRKRKPTGPAKLFVLDTNVLLHDPMCLFRFEEHDIFLPMIVLEELDGHKKGMTEVARNARQTSRSLDALAASSGADIGNGLRLDATGHRDARGKLFFQTHALGYSLPSSLPQGKADNQILGVVEALRQQHAGAASGAPDREVVLVSKDINMRVKARALGLATDDYQNDKTLDDGDLLYAGSFALPGDFWATHGQTVESWQHGVHTFYRVSGPVVPNLLINQFVYFESPGEPSLYARVTEIRGKTAVFKTLKDYNHLKNAVWGVTTRNREQNFAMNLLMDPEVDFVTLTVARVMMISV